MLKIIIFSKDRAAQLELLLRSIKYNLKIPYEIVVQYTTSNDDYEKGYKICKDSYEIKLIKESNFKKTLIGIMDNTNTNFMFLVDDNVFINELTEIDYRNLLETYYNNSNSNIHTISLRMHNKIDYCYPAKKQMVIPQFIRDNEVLIWDWTKMDQWTCWGYPMHVDSQIFTDSRLAELTNIIINDNYRHPNSLEEALLRHKNKDKNLMISPSKAIIWNIQNNFVQNKNTNLYDNVVEENNNKFIKGKRISLKNIQGIKSNMAHGVVDFIWE